MILTTWSLRRRRRWSLTASAPVHHHSGQQAVNYVQVLVEVQHRYGGHLAGGAARTGARIRARLVGELGEMGVRVLLQEHHRTLSRTVVGLVLFGCNDPVPAKVLEVHRQREPAAQLLFRVIVAVLAQHVAFGPRPTAVFRVHLQVRDLRKNPHGSVTTSTGVKEFWWTMGGPG